jgi:hypothetical protein
MCSASEDIRLQAVFEAALAGARRLEKGRQKECKAPLKDVSCGVGARRGGHRQMATNIHRIWLNCEAVPGVMIIIYVRLREGGLEV